MASEIPTSEDVVEAFKEHVVPVLTGFYEAYKHLYDQREAMKSLLEEVATIIEEEWGPETPEHVGARIRALLASLEDTEAPPA